ncbi:hypothetical protein V8E36_009055 [Tilletia maclaganii]
MLTVLMMDVVVVVVEVVLLEGDIPTDPHPYTHSSVLPPPHPPSTSYYLTRNTMPPKASSSKKDAASGIDDELDAFVDEFLKINLRKQRAEAAKFAKGLKERVDRAEREAMAKVTAVGKDLNKILPPTDKGKNGSDKNLERTIASVNAALEDVLGTMQICLEQYQGDVDKTLVDSDERILLGSDSRLSAEELRMLDSALADRPHHLVLHAHKLIKKHQAEQQKRAERKEVGLHARELVRQCMRVDKK